MTSYRKRLVYCMCSQFELRAHPRDLARRFGFDSITETFKLGEIRPTDGILSINFDGPFVLPWGLVVDWSRGPLINARAETLNHKKTFQPHLKNRCLIPASAYFEWRQDGNSKHKNRITTEQGRLFSFAGFSNGEQVTIITCKPQLAISCIHDRMPVVLPSAYEPAWINPNASFPNVAYMLKPNSASRLSAEEEVVIPPHQGELFGPIGDS